MSNQEKPAQIIDSNSGWRFLAKSMVVHAPQGLAQSEKTRAGIRSLIRTGR